MSPKEKQCHVFLVCTIVTLFPVFTETHSRTVTSIFESISMTRKAQLLHNNTIYEMGSVIH